MSIKKYASYLFGFGHFSTDWCQGALPALLPFFIANYGFSYKDAASLMFANVLLSSLLQPFIGYYADKVSKPWFVPLGALCCGAAATVMGFASSYWILFAAALLSGVGAALFHPEGALMVNRYGGEQKGKAMGIFAVGGNAGFAIGPFIAGIIAYRLGIEYMAFFGLVNLISATALLFGINMLFKEAKADVKKAEKVGEGTNDWISFGKLGLCIFTRSVGFTISNTFIPLLWIFAGATAAEGSNALTFLVAVGTCFTFFGGKYSDRIGYKTTIVVSFAMMIPAFFFLTHVDDLWIKLALLVPCAFSVFFPFSPTVVLGQKYLGKNKGLASGVTLGLSTTMGGLVAPFVGWMADHYGLISALQILWVVGIVGLLAGISLPKEREA